MVWCPICEKTFRDLSTLRRHSKQFHPDKIDEIAPKKLSNKGIKAICDDCGKHFSIYSSLTRHVRKFHSDKINVLTKPSNECGICGKHFKHLKSLTYHQRNHLEESTEGLMLECTNRKRQNLKCSLCKSEDTFGKDEILKHFKVAHDIKLFSDNLKFSSVSEFYLWKNQMEIETKCHFINKHGSNPTKTHLKKQFFCHRSGTYKPEGSGRRHLKKQGSNKINGYCPAEISLTVSQNGLCEVNFQTVHIGHNQDLEHLTLSKTERETIAAKIAAKIPFETIIDEVREESIAENKFERLHLLKKKDLYNIEQCFNLNNETERHAKDTQRFLKNDSVNRQDVTTPDLEELDDNELIIIENLQTCEQEQNNLFEVIIDGKENKYMGELHFEKAKLKLNLNKLVDGIESYEELTTIKKFVAPMEPTLDAMRSEKMNMMYCNNISEKIPHNKYISQQRRLLKLH